MREKSRQILKNIALGKYDAATSSLTIDEVVWKIAKETKDRDKAIKESLRILMFNNLKIIEIGKMEIFFSLALMQKNKNLDPRDAIHLSAADKFGTNLIASDDDDFDKFEGIKRVGLV